MKARQSSITAQGIALIRAIESRKPEGERICNDPLAHYFVNPLLSAFGGFFAWYGERISPGVMGFLVARARYIDDYLQTCLANGLEQLVILGAGFDSRAYRFDALKDRVRVFEVDHPATQAVKIARIEEIFGKLPDHVVYVPLDFAREMLERLICYGFDKRLKTLFIWEGVTYYIPAEAVDATLNFVAQNSGAESSIVFDYAEAGALHSSRQRAEVSRMHRYSRITGEDMVFGIPQGTLETYVRRHGFDQVKNVTPQDLKSTYFTGVNARRPIAPVYSIAAATIRLHVAAEEDTTDDVPAAV